MGHQYGEVSEWFKELVLKPVMLNGTVGSNPTLSAKIAQIAQSVEQGTENPRVGGSIPPGGTIIQMSVWTLI